METEVHISFIQQFHSFSFNNKNNLQNIIFLLVFLFVSSCYLQLHGIKCWSILQPVINETQLFSIDHSLMVENKMTTRQHSD